MDNNSQTHYSPHLIAGLTQEEIVRFVEERLGHDTCVDLANEYGTDHVMLLGTDLYRRERLLRLWDNPQNDEEQTIIRLVHLGTPLGLHLLGAAHATYDGVEPVLQRVKGEWLLGCDADNSVVLRAGTPQEAVKAAFEWMADAEIDVGPPLPLPENPPEAG